MKVIKINLSENLQTLELHLFADEHIGDEHSDILRLKQRIDHVANKENAYCILNGDIIDYASRTSIGDIETREFNIMGQIEKAVELFTPIKDKIICVTSGNHENRSYRKEGIDVTRIIAAQMGLLDRYATSSAYIYLRFGSPNKKHGNSKKKMLYTIFCNHGSGGGRKEGAKAIRLADMGTVCDADIYIHSHTHLPMVMKQGYHRPCFNNSSISNCTRLFVNTASNLDYGGYGEAQEYKPNSKDTPTIYLDGSVKKMIANL